MSFTGAQLESLLDLKQVDSSHFTGVSPQDLQHPAVYGGQVMAQALRAACYTLDDAQRTAHALHACFLAAGDPQAPLLYAVHPLRDGRSFSARQVQAMQHDKVIFTMFASFQRPESGLQHQRPMPFAPAPETLAPEHEVRHRNALTDGKMSADDALRYASAQPFEVRRITPVNDFQPQQATSDHALWMRIPAALPDDEPVHRCALAYLSDWSLLEACTLMHGLSFLSQGLHIASLNHALWFHRPFRADDWLLYITRSPVSGGGRGFSEGLIYAKDGTLVASTAQEGLIRMTGTRARAPARGDVPGVSTGAHTR